MGLVVSIYVHEMGHVAALMRYGIRGECAPVHSGTWCVYPIKQAFTDPRQDACALAWPVRSGGWGGGSSAPIVVIDGPADLCGAGADCAHGLTCSI